MRTRAYKDWRRLYGAWHVIHWQRQWLFARLGDNHQSLTFRQAAADGLVSGSRQALVFTQAEAAEAVGCSPTTWARWERGEQEPKGVYRHRLFLFCQEAHRREMENVSPFPLTEWKWTWYSGGQVPYACQWRFTAEGPRFRLTPQSREYGAASDAWQAATASQMAEAHANYKLLFGAEDSHGNAQTQAD